MKSVPPPPPPTAEALDGRLRKLEVRMAQVVDVVDIYGPPPTRRRLPIPELTYEQKRTVALALFFVFMLTMPRIIAASKGED